MWVKKVGPFQVAALNGSVNRSLYIDRMPYDSPKHWRVIVTRHPVWLPFSERNGYRPMPRIYQIGPFDIAIYTGAR